MSQREVHELQRAPIILGIGWASGACEFCLWRGPEHNRNTFSIDEVEGESRKHLGEQHPGKVAYWKDDA